MNLVERLRCMAADTIGNAAADRIEQLESALVVARDALNSFDPYDDFADLWQKKDDCDVDAALAKINEVMGVK